MKSKGNSIIPSEAAAALGRIKTEKKSAAVRANGAKGGRPRRDLASYPCSCAGGASERDQDHKTTCPRGRILRQRARQKPLRGNAT